MKCVHSDYLDRALIPKSRRLCIRRSVETANKMLTDFRLEAVAVTGWSGALVGIPVADALGLPITFIRKSEDGSHSCMNVEGFIRPGAGVLLVDDGVYSGNTLTRARKALYSPKCHDSPPGMKIAGLLLYCDFSTSTAGALMAKANPGEALYLYTAGRVLGYCLGSFRRRREVNGKMLSLKAV